MSGKPVAILKPYTSTFICVSSLFIELHLLQRLVPLCREQLARNIQVTHY